MFWVLLYGFERVNDRLNIVFVEEFFGNFRFGNRRQGLVQIIGFDVVRNRTPLLMKGEVEAGTLGEEETRALSNQDFPSPEAAVRKITGVVPKIKPVIFDHKVIIGSGISNEANFVINNRQIHARKRDKIRVSLG